MTTKAHPMRSSSLRRGALAAFAGFALLLAVPFASAQQGAWPSQPIKLVVPFPPGGGTDVLARMLADKLRPQLNQTVVIDNRPGATGNIGNDIVAKATPDGHTLLIQGTIIGMFPHIFEKLAYDPLKNLVAIGTVAESPNVIVVHPESPFQTLQDLVRAGKADPARPMNYGTAGVGSPQHLAMEQLASLAGVKLQHVNYRGTTPAVNDLLAKQTHFGAYSLSSMLPLIQGQKVRVLAVLTEKRTELLPNVPAMSELGYKGVDSSIRFALFAPAGTPPDVIAKAAAANAKAIADPALKENFHKAGYEIVTATPQQTAAMVQREYTLWGPIVKQLGLKPE
jgi:tripartite-type tricarboxylate transporter receptor subunit TctC